MFSNAGICPRCFSPVLPVFLELPDPDVTYGLPTPEAFEDPKFKWGGCLVELPVPDHYFCANCDIGIPTRNVIFA